MTKTNEDYLGQREDVTGFAGVSQATTQVADLSNNTSETVLFGAQGPVCCGRRACSGVIDARPGCDSEVESLESEESLLCSECSTQHDADFSNSRVAIAISHPELLFASEEDRILRRLDSYMHDSVGRRILARRAQSCTWVQFRRSRGTYDLVVPPNIRSVLHNRTFSRAFREEYELHHRGPTLHSNIFEKQGLTDWLFSTTREAGVNAGAGLVAGIRDELKQSFSASPPGELEWLLDKAVDYGTVATAAYLSEQGSVRILLVVNLINKLVRDLGLVAHIKSIFHHFYQQLVKHARVDGGMSEEEHDLLATHLIGEIPPGVFSEVAEFTPQSSRVKQALTIQVVLMALREIVTYLKSLLSKWFETNRWRFMREHLKANHRNLYMLLEGSRYIREKGGNSWIHSSPKNAIFAARVLHYANLAQTQYETEPCPIDKTYLKDLILSARSSALLSNSLVSGARPGAVILYIHGPTRQGKSVATQIITAELNKKLGVDPTTSFSFPISSQFKEGYCCQPVCLLSDTFKLCASENRVPEAEFIMQAHDTTPFPLDMAVAEKKGTVFFQSSYLLCSSNIDITVGDATLYGLAQKDPILTRFDFYAKCTCIDHDIMDRTPHGWEINDTKAEDKYPDGVSPDIYQFALYKALDGRFLENVTLMELVERMDRCRDKRYKRYAGAQVGTDWDAIDGTILAFGLGYDSPPEIGTHVPRDYMEERAPGWVPPSERSPAPEHTSQSASSEPNWAKKLLDSYWALVEEGYAAVQNYSRLAKEFVGGANLLTISGLKMHAGCCAGFLPTEAQMKAHFEYVQDFSKRMALLAATSKLLNVAVMFLVGFGGAMALNRGVAAIKRAVHNPDIEVSSPQQEAYETKLVKHRVVKFSPQRVQPEGGGVFAPDVVAKNVAAVNARADEVEQFLSSQFPVDRTVAQTHDLIVDVPDVTHTITGQNAQPFVRQGCDDVNALQMVGHAMANQLYWGAITNKDRVTMSYGQFFNVCGLYYLCPLHVGKALATASLVELFGNHTLVIEASLFKVVKELPHSELMILELPRGHGFTEGKNMISKLIDASETHRVSSRVLAAVRLFNTTHTAAYFGSSNVEPVTSATVQALNESCNYRILSAFRYPLMQTFKGMCGAPIVSMGGELSGKIFAFHCAGESSSAGGIGAPIHLSDFDFMVPPRVAPPLVNVTPWEEPSSPVPISWGRVKTELYQRQSTSSNLRRSRVFGWKGAPPTMPAHLKCVNGINPMALGQAKWFGPAYTVDVANTDRACGLITSVIKAEFAKRGEPPCRKLSIMESVAGIPGEIPSINLQTSPGFPFNRLMGGNKTQWVSRDSDTGEVLAIHPFLEECVERMDTELSQGVVPFVVFRDSLKDETRPLAKVSKGATRVFSGAPVDYTICFRQYLADFTNKLVRFCVDLPVKIGLDVHGNDWGLQWKRFQRIPGDNWLNGDCRNFDGTELALHVMKVFMKVFVEFHPEYATQIEALGMALANAIHIFEDILYQVTHGVPSGTPATSLVNSLVLWLVHLLTWLHVGYKLSDYVEAVEGAFFGDDSLSKVDPAWPKYNMVAVASYCKSIGMEYTMADKSDKLVPYVGASEVTFLKRSFVYDDRLAVWKAPLPWEVINDIPNWQRGSEMSEIDQLRATFDSFCVEVSHYSEEEYWRATHELEMVLADAGVVVAAPPYQTLMLRYQDV